MAENDCIKGYYKTVNGKKYGPYAYSKKDKGKCKFTAKDITRILVFARKEGLVSDEELLSAWGQATNNKSLICAVAGMWQVLNMNFTLLTIISLLKAILTILKGLKMLATGKKSKFVSTILELVVPKKYWEELGLFLVCSGSLEAIILSFIYMMQTIIDNAVAAQMVKAACAADVFIMPVDYKNPKKGSGDPIAVAINGFVHTLNTEIPIVQDADKNFLDKYLSDPVDFELSLMTLPLDLMMQPIKDVWGDIKEDVPTLPNADYSFSFLDAIFGKVKIDPAPSILAPDKSPPLVPESIP